MLRKFFLGALLLALVFTGYLYTQALQSADVNPTGLAQNTATVQLKPCPDSPNCVSTQATTDSQKREPLAFTGSVAAAKARLMKIVGETKRTELQKDDGNYLHYTFKTWPIPFIDDVEFIIDDAAGLIHYRSASRVGYSDMGVNSRRMQKITDAWNG